MLSSILKLVFLSQLIILSLETYDEYRYCQLYANEMKNKTRTTLVPGNDVYRVGFYADVSSWTEGKEIPFYVEMSMNDFLDSSEREIFTTFVYFQDDPPTNENNVCKFDSDGTVTYKSTANGTDEDYKKFRYKVTKPNNKYLLVVVDTRAEGGFYKKVYFYLGDDGLSKKTIIIIVIVLVVILLIAGIVALVLFMKKKKKQKQKTQNQQQMNQQQAYNQQQVYNQQQMYNQNQAYNQQQMYNQNQMYNQQQGQTQVLYNEYGQQYVNNVQVNNQGIAPTDNQGNAQYGGIVVVYPSDGNTPGK